MAKRTLSLISKFSLISALALAPPVATGAEPPEILLLTADGKSIRLEEENMTSLSSRPLIKTRARLNEKYKKEFLFLYRVKIPDGASIIGRTKVGKGPVRLTVYEITKKQDSVRRLRVVRSKVRQTGEIAEFRTVVQKFDEHLYLITAEAVHSEAQLNPHLRYMNSQNNEIILKGFSTDWNFSSLRFHLSGKDETEKKEAEFTKDADLLVNHLINPQWVVSIRLE
jgi:hypothetical protein